MAPGPAKPVFKRRLPWGWLFLGALALLAVLGMVSARNAPLRLAVTAPTVFQAGERNPVLTASGYLVARHRATLSAKILGRLAWLGVEEGSQVTRGQIIARLEAPDVEASRLRAETNLKQAELDLERNEALFREGVLDRATLDRQRSTTASLKAELAYQDALLENMVLRAPFTGTVTQKLSEVGETVSPGSAGGANAINAIATLADFASLEVEVEVNETGLPRLRKGMPAEIRVDALDAEPGARPLRGQLREIYPSSNRQKATVLVRVALVDRNPVLVPEMGARITFLGEPFAARTLFLGREQVVRRRGRPCVWTLRNGRAALLPVELGPENPIGFEVRGIPPDLPLLVVPQELKLDEGKRVVPRES